MLFRASVSSVFVFASHHFDRFKEKSLIGDTPDYPIFLVAFLLFAEILPLFCFLMFLFLAINTREIGNTTTLET